MKPTAAESLPGRLSIVFAVLLLACCAASAWLQMAASARQENEVAQRLSLGLAAHIAGSAELMRPDGPDAAAVHGLFDKLMAVNPSVEVYLLDPGGRILAQAAPPDHLRRQRVDLAPVRRLLGGAALPVLGDDPRAEHGSKVFSAAPLRVGDRDAGFVYVVLSGEDRDAISARLAADAAVQTSLRSMALVALLGLVAGFAALRFVTRPLRELTGAVGVFEHDGVEAFARPMPALERVAGGRDDIALLARSFAAMRQRIAEQWQALTQQDRQRRELFANVSHDLRTPLTSLHGYLETLRVKGDVLDDDDRRRYLDLALGQSRKVGRLAQEIFDLARLEHGAVEPEKESFALADLVQDVFQKFELAAQERRQQLVAGIDAELPNVTADLGLIERVLTNLIDNAIRLTPEGGEIRVGLAAQGGGVEVEVSDTGPGVPEALRTVIFERPAFDPHRRGGGGLGLLIVRRILQLHGSEIRLLSRAGRGAVFAFRLG